MSKEKAADGTLEAPRGSFAKSTTGQTPQQQVSLQWKDRDFQRDIANQDRIRQRKDAFHNFVEDYQKRLQLLEKTLPE